MFFLGFDELLIEAWLEGDTRPLRPELHREDTAPTPDRPLERFEVLGIEFLPRLARKPVEPNAVPSWRP